MYRWVAWAITVVSAVLLVMGGIGLMVGASAADAQDVVWYWSSCALCLPSLTLGIVIATRRPANPVGALLCFVGFAVALVPSAEIYGMAAAAYPHLLPFPPVIVAFTQVLWVLYYLPVALLMLYFPDGVLLGPRWRWVVWGLWLDAAVFIVVGGMAPGEFRPPFEHVPRVLPTLPEVVMPVVLLLPLGFFALLVASATAMGRKFRRTANDPVRRAQLSWLALASLWLPVTLLLCWLSYLLWGGPDLVLAGLYGLFIAIPTATAIAMLRHDLYDVDKAISTAITYTAVTGALLCVYTVVSLLGGVLIGQGSAVAAAAATAVCATALAPVRIRLRRAVDRRLFPQRRAALDAIEGLRARTYAGMAQPEQLESVLRSALRDPALRVAYQLPGTQMLVGADGTPASHLTGQRTPIVLSGQQIGVLVRGKVGSVQLLAEIADACVLLVEVVRLRIELAAALREVESSRSRLLLAGYRERRRLERDLHDGAQQRLVALGMTLRLAQRHLCDSTVDVDGLLDQSVAELGIAVAELRAIAHGLRPATLDDGLDVAVRALAGSLTLPVTVDIAIGDISDDLATTAYYVVSEAITNVVKHADATSMGLRLNQDNGYLTVDVRDNGRGGAGSRPGSGLAGLTDRVAAAAGTLLVESPAGHGTVIRAVLPCAS